MKKIAIVMAGLAAALVVGEVSSAFAQAESAASARRKIVVGHHTGSAKYRPLTVTAPATGPVEGAVGVAGSTAGAAVAGVGGLIAAPFAGLGGGSVGISPVAAPPLPIKARYSNTGKVFSTYDEGYAQDVPVDATGPIYKIDDAAIRTVTPFSLAAFPITAATSVISAPFRPATP